MAERGRLWTRGGSLGTRYLYDLAKTGRLGNIGNKARGLWYLYKKGFAIPKTYVCTWDAYLRFDQGDRNVLESVRTELEERLEPGRRYAVRSSANVEYTSARSFAGQFKTVLDARGSQEIVRAIEAIWEEANSWRDSAYPDVTESGVGALKMALLIQESVSPVVSGVSFSVNPVTGMDEIIVEAVLGSGEALVQAGATPERWVNKWGNWIEGNLQGASHGAGIPLSMVEQVVRQTRTIAEAFGHSSAAHELVHVWHHPVHVRACPAVGRALSVDRAPGGHPACPWPGPGGLCGRHPRRFVARGSEAHCQAATVQRRSGIGSHRRRVFHPRRARDVRSHRLDQPVQRV